MHVVVIVEGLTGDAFQQRVAFALVWTWLCGQGVTRGVVFMSRLTWNA